MIEADVVIVGAGPAGSTAALNLAPTRRVVMIERLPQIPPRIGESLVPAARRLFTDMGLWPSFEAEPHVPCYGNRSVWGSNEPVESDFMRGPDGHGWHLDRGRFDAWLRVVAIGRGARLLAPAQMEDIERSEGTWRLSLATATGKVGLTARFLIDAGGRAAPLARRLGARRRRHDRLVCGWIHGGSFGSNGMTFIEAVEDGWWYTAPLPNDRRVLAFHTDANLASAGIARDREAMLRHATSATHLSELLSSVKFTPDERSGFTAAHGAHLTPCAGEGWLATGDAAINFDPLSSLGLFNALYTGLAAAEATEGYLLDAANALSGYERTIADIRNVYAERLALWYGTETRWRECPFWRCRIETAHENARAPQAPHL
ncbi:NAD(P)/FAD-dependent oxidoreductase (plasmid) [Bradyrhizobium barranii subsp. apii]|uniref:NAD(P)/FAD-dependent oxidoreductase n=1 Tax=Bradyrhizobium barranii subsp. apii TaxID=2819348 RepID=A0A8T5VSH0_9BRAD|nr:NAD(P)/FAD-dependent oxidoreductase [Bradyrhizobium barranii]UPT92449.1 NAD(P)/FAD-dependent oxidoreductase [Bradyrhizobium barranii subsp. apii]